MPPESQRFLRQVHQEFDLDGRPAGFFALGRLRETRLVDSELGPEDLRQELMLVLQIIGKSCELGYTRSL